VPAYIVNAKYIDFGCPGTGKTLVTALREIAAQPGSSVFALPGAGPLPRVPEPYDEMLTQTQRSGCISASKPLCQYHRWRFNPRTLIKFMLGYQWQQRTIALFSAPWPVRF